MDKAVFESQQHYGNLHSVIKKQMAGKPIIYRLTGQSSRIYFTKPTDNSQVTIYNSGTTLIDNFRDKAGEEAIHKWKVGLINSGKDPYLELGIRQDYGTILHLLYGKILMGDTFTFYDLSDKIKECANESKISKESLDRLLSSNMVEFKKDIACFITWIRDYQVEPLAVELMLKSDKYRVATALDLICYVTDKVKGNWGEVYKSGAKKGEPKESYKEVRRLVIVDFKSGKKGFYSKNVLQLLLSRDIFEENFPDLIVDSVYNFAPNDWNGTNPTYKFYDQERETKGIDYLKKIKDNVFERGLIEFEEVLSKKSEVLFNGIIGIGQALDSMVTYATLEELANRYYEEFLIIDREFFNKLVNKESLTTELKLIKYLESKKEKELEKLSTSIGIKYNNKIDFIQRLTLKWQIENQK